MSSQCAGCGAGIEGGAGACQSLFDQLIARDFSDYRYGAVHRMVVDCYCLQHPDRYCRSAKSLMAHLGGLCCAVERGNDAGELAALQRSLNGKPDLEKPVVPVWRGAVTILHVSRATAPDEHRAWVGRWVRSVWDAYAPLHDWARAWMSRAVAA